MEDVASFPVLRASFPVNNIQGVESVVIDETLEYPPVCCWPMDI